MEIAILLLEILILLLLGVLFLRKNGRPSASQKEEIEALVEEKIEALGQQLRQMEHTAEQQTRLLLDQASRQENTTVQQIAALGKMLQEVQGQQQGQQDATLRRMEEQLSRLRQENQRSFDQFRTELLAALDGIRRSNTESLDRLRQENQQSLDKINSTVNEKLQKTLDDRITQSFQLVNQRLAEVYQGLGEMKNVASGVADLKHVLSNVKTRGILGEIQLGGILGEILSPEQYGEQVQLAPGSSLRVDYAVKLPGATDGETVWLPIDAKFPGDTYGALLDAYDTGDGAQLKEKRTLLEAEIKRCAKSIHDKYILPPYTTDFAILFLPFEGLYAEVINMGLVEPLQRQYHINVTGPSTMAAMLNSLQMGFRTLAIQKKSGEVWKILEAAKKEFGNFAAVLNKTRDRLRQADEELDRLIGTRTRAINRKLQQVSALETDQDADALLELDPKND